MNRRKRRRRRRVGGLMVFAGGLLVLGGLWLVITGVMADHELARARTDVHTMRAEVSAGNVLAARATAADFAKHAGRAHHLTSGPAWALAADVPLAGHPVTTVRGMTSAIDKIATDALPSLVRASSGIDPAVLRNAAGTVEVGRISDAVPALDYASSVVSRTAAKLAKLPQSTWLPAVDDARRDLAAQLAGLRAQLGSADSAAHVFPVMLGADGPKRYFVAFENDAEARGTGGLPGAFAIVQVDHGTIRFLRFSSDATLDGVAAQVNFGPAYDQLYTGADTTTDYRNSNLSPNFPYAAQIWCSMWERKTGQHLDGAMALDPTALGYLLAVTGPAMLPDKTVVSSRNVVALTQSDVYRRFTTDNAARRAFLLSVARAVSARVIDPHVSTAALVKAAGRAAAEGRLLFWTADPTVEAQLATTPLSGVIRTTTSPFAGLSIVNDGGNKLDYYLDRRLVWQRIGCGTRRSVLVTITLTNTAPARGLPPYVTARSDTHEYPVVPGDNRLEVTYLATQGALMTAATLDGRNVVASIGSEHQHPAYTVDVELPHGASRTIVLLLSEPGTAGPPTVVRQPLVRPLSVTVDDATCT